MTSSELAEVEQLRARLVAEHEALSEAHDKLHLELVRVQMDRELELRRRKRMREEIQQLQKALEQVTRERDEAREALGRSRADVLRDLPGRVAHRLRGTR